MPYNEKEINYLIEEFVESVENRSGLKVKASYTATDEKVEVSSYTDFIEDIELDYFDVNGLLGTMDQYIEKKDICSINELDMKFIDNASKFYSISPKTLLNLIASSIASRPLDYEYDLLDAIEERTGHGVNVELTLSKFN